MGSYSFKIRVFSFLFLPHLRSRYVYNFGQAKLGHMSPSRVSFPLIIRQQALAAVTGAYMCDIP